MPAGFTDDGVPIGIELLGPAWSEPKLLALAFSYEQAAHPRRAPAAAPALVDGKAPPAHTFVANLNGAHTTFTFDPVAGTLAWDVTSTRPLVASLHRGAPGPGAGDADDQQGERIGRDRHAAARGPRRAAAPTACSWSCGRWTRRSRVERAPLRIGPAPKR